MMFFVAIPALVQAAPAPPAPPPAASAVAPTAAGLEAARRLLKATNIEQQYDLNFARLIPLVTKQIFNSIKDNSKVPPRVRNFLNDPANLDRAERDFAERLKKGFQQRYPRLIDEAARAYAQAFTVEELNALAAFYDSPLGQKTLAELPELQNKLFMVGGTLGMEVGKEAIRQTLEALLPEPGAIS